MHDFDSVVDAWEANKINRSQLIDHLKEFGYEGDDLNFILTNLEEDREHMECQKMGEEMREAFELGHMEKALDRAMKILNRLGHNRGW